MDEPIIWVCVSIISILSFVIIKFTYCDIIILDNNSDCTADISENSSDI